MIDTIDPLIVQQQGIGLYLTGTSMFVIEAIFSSAFLTGFFMNISIFMWATRYMYGWF